VPAADETRDAEGHKLLKRVSGVTTLVLNHDLEFEDLYHREGLARIDSLFIEHLSGSDPDLGKRLLQARERPDDLDKKEISGLLTDLAPYVEDFVADLFRIQPQVLKLAERRNTLAPLYACKRQFIHRQVKAAGSQPPREDAGERTRARLEAAFSEPFTELTFARHVLRWLEDRERHAVELQLASDYANWAVHSETGRERHADGILFRLPRKTDPMHLVTLETVESNGVQKLGIPPERQHQRDGFNLTHQIGERETVLDQANYCIWCHRQQRDSCSKGMRDKKTGAFRKNAFDLPMTGCPLEEHISEMNMLMAQGCTLGALAIVTVNNPMVPGTGFRICNDCMKACIYQRQEAVNIPMIETSMLKDVLSLPWGFEIYGLLTRWNPLNLHRPMPEKSTGYKVLVVGLGPAGYTLAHHLMNEGHHVIAVDGLKIEPLPAELTGVTDSGERVPFRPVRDIQELYEPLDERLMAGFGGLAEYGITVRWDKNFLKVIRITLERREQFTMYGGVRFGGTLTIDSAFELGFDHIALCVGAGNPTFISIPNIMARGVRMASDFFMALQLAGAAKKTSLASLQIRMPVIVIGGGLTAIDAATESMAYYPLQVEKFLCRYEALCKEHGEEAIRSMWSEEECAIAEEFIRHARIIREERSAAAREGRKPAIRKLLDSWGGVTIAYRRRLIDSPAYTLNDEEVSSAMEEGIRFAELLSPVSVEVDAYGHASGLRMTVRKVDASGRIVDTDETVSLPARTILVAAGTKPNTVLAREEPEHVRLDGHHFQTFDLNGNPVTPEQMPKPEQVHVLMNMRPDGRSMSYYGDSHPSFAGNVVRAMASAMHGSSIVSHHMKQNAPTSTNAEALKKRLDQCLRPTVRQINRLTPQVLEIVVHAPLAARAFQPGQFYRLQNFESYAKYVDQTCLAMEGIPVGGSVLDPEEGLVSLIIHSSQKGFDLCCLLRPGEPVNLMGPTGTPTEIRGGENVLLLGEEQGHAFLPPIGKAFRAKGSRVIYFAGYKTPNERYKIEQIEEAADVVVWCCEKSPGFRPGRTQDLSFSGSLVEAVKGCASGRLGKTAIALSDIDRLIAIGPEAMMAAVSRARQKELSGVLKPGLKAIGSINSPMQCMMKEICARCLQTHHYPESGSRTVVYSCCDQDQPLERVDFDVLHDRRRQDSVQEKLTRLWIRHCLARLESKDP